MRPRAVSSAETSAGGCLSGRENAVFWCTVRPFCLRACSVAPWTATSAQRPPRLRPGSFGGSPPLGPSSCPPDARLCVGRAHTLASGGSVSVLRHGPRGGGWRGPAHPGGDESTPPRPSPTGGGPRPAPGPPGAVGPAAGCKRCGWVDRRSLDRGLGEGELDLPAGGVGWCPGFAWAPAVGPLCRSPPVLGSRVVTPRPGTESPCSMAPKIQGASGS